jgi:putative ABC transport system permease protein
VDPKTFLDVYPEFKVPKDQFEGWLKDRQGALVGKQIAENNGWKIGDRVPLISPSWNPKDPWEFNISAIYDGERTVDKTQFFLRYDYLHENQGQENDTVGWYVIKIQDPSQAKALGDQFDEMFKNSPAETKTTTEKGFVEGFAKQMGDIGAITVAISAVVLFMFGLVAASTMVQSVRERTSELAVLKTLGFRDTTILFLVLLESLFITVTAGGLGLAVAWLIAQSGDPTGVLPVFVLPERDIIAGVLPAVGAMRLKITDALRRV